MSRGDLCRLPHYEHHRSEIGNWEICCWVSKDRIGMKLLVNRNLRPIMLCWNVSSAPRLTTYNALEGIGVRLILKFIVENWIGEVEKPPIAGWTSGSRAVQQDRVVIRERVFLGRRRQKNSCYFKRFFSINWVTLVLGAYRATSVSMGGILKLQKVRFKDFCID